MFREAINTVERKFRDLGLKTTEIQLPDPTVGIRFGYVVFEHDGEEWEIDYDFQFALDTKEDILKESVIYAE